MSEGAGDSTHRYLVRRQEQDPWLHARHAAGWESRYEQLTSAAFHGQITGACLDSMQIFCEEVNSPYRYYGHPWKGSRVFFSCFPQTGSLYYDNRSLPDSCFATHLWNSFDRVWCRGSFKAVYVALDEGLFQRHTERVVGRRFFDDQHDAIVSNPDPAVAHKFRYDAMQILQDCMAAPDALSSQHSRRTIENRILALLIEVLEASGESASRLPPPTTRAYIVDKAMQFIEARLADPIGLADMCEAVRVSPRTLRYSFEEILGVPPMRYLLSRRLNQARRELSTGPQQSIIEEIAVRCGFWHMGRFAQFYRQSFGERPSDTLRRALTNTPTRSHCTYS